MEAHHGLELEAFLGKASEMREWKTALPSVVVCRFSGDLGLVPLTGELIEELRARLGQVGANRLDAAQKHAAYKKGVRVWGSEASRNTTVAYISAFEFGNQSSEKAIVWSNGKKMLSGDDIEAVLQYFRDQAAVDLGTTTIDLGQYRKEDAAEKWAAAGILDELMDQSDQPITALTEALRYERKGESIQKLVRQFAAEGLGKMGPEARGAIPALIEALEDEDWTVRCAAAEVLGQTGSESSDVVSALNDARSDKHELVRGAVGQALTRIRKGPSSGASSRPTSAEPPPGTSLPTRS